MPVINVLCAGISPLIMGSKKLYKEPLPPNISPEEEASLHLKQDPHGNIGIPSHSLWLALQRAGSYTGVRVAPNLVRISIDILEPFLLLRPCEWQIERGIGDTFHKDKLAVFHKPRFDEWGFVATLEYEPCFITKPIVRELLEQAGDAVGLGSFTPTTGCGPYGRFEVTEWN